ncbi:hypothetical protein HYH03_005197 [Edaphochlamys debaryana]|uniref:Uncharacterized protein n=1 Tax=Edaphochlamys debaryana TaxID=47281 RepID=A0A835YFS5_9CHLO|nr:hypothetical protein HYH03_005197 [Edaphochlamys debaryana]|eukprot:KAG2496789.1 hypothetical protein HYH03_005197 [Edaphochlamys debaryana]
MALCPRRCPLGPAEHARPTAAPVPHPQASSSASAATASALTAASLRALLRLSRRGASSRRNSEAGRSRGLPATAAAGAPPQVGNSGGEPDPLAGTTAAAAAAAAAVSTSAAGTSNSAAASAALNDGVGMVGGVPWKVQWQLRGLGSMDATASLDGSSDPSPTLVSAQQLQQQIAALQQFPPFPPHPQLVWTPFDRADAVRAAALEASGWSAADFDDRFAVLSALLPDLPSVLADLPPATLAGAMRDPRLLAAKVVTLKSALPSTNVGMLLLLHAPLLEPTVRPEHLLAGVEHAADVLGGHEVAEEVLQWYPPLLDPKTLDDSIAQVRRLVPQLSKRCLPPPRGSNAPFAGGQGVGGGDARQLVHLLGIVMKSSGGSQERMWWDS